MQLDLFDSGAADLDFGSAVRTRLDAHSWVEQVPGWLADGDALLRTLREGSGWEQRERWMYTRTVTEPRLTAEHPVLADAPDELRRLARALSDHYGVEYDGLWLNLYRDHHDATGWHGDATSCRLPECVVPVLSLGAPRRFLIRPAAGGPSTAFRPLSGDLIVMGGRAQVDWRHSVPRQAAPSGPRISVNFSSSAQAAPPL